jgi:hypothetical protein
MDPRRSGRAAFVFSYLPTAAIPPPTNRLTILNLRWRFSGALPRRIVQLQYPTSRVSDVAAGLRVAARELACVHRTRGHADLDRAHVSAGGNAARVDAHPPRFHAADRTHFTRRLGPRACLPPSHRPRSSQVPTRERLDTRATSANRRRRRRRATHQSDTPGARIASESSAP